VGYRYMTFSTSTCVIGGMTGLIPTLDLPNAYITTYVTPMSSNANTWLGTLDVGTVLSKLCPLSDEVLDHLWDH